MSPEKILPHNIEAEEQVSGALLIDGSTISTIADSLSPNSFYSDRCRPIYEACLALYQRNDPINQLTVGQELNNKGKLEAVGGAAYLSYLIATCATSMDIEHHAETVHRLAVMRQLVYVSEDIAEIGYKANASIDDAIDQVRALVDGIRPTKSKHLDLSNMRITKSTPPHYRLNVNGIDMRFSIYELQVWGKFKSRVLGELDFIPAKPKNWEGLVNRLLDIAQKEEAPVDTSVEVGIKLSVKGWFEQRGEGREYSDVQSGSYVIVPYRGKETNFEQREYWAFQPTPLLRWLRRDMGRVITRDTLWSMALDWGAVKHQWRVGKENSMPLKLWALPPDFAVSAEFAVEKQVELPVETKPEEEEELPDI